MIGGDHADIERARPLLKHMGTKLIEFGAAGSGQAAKACHNMICGITALAVCESFALADALELDLDKFFQLCSGAAAQSWILENRCPVPGPAPAAPASNDYAPGFAARLMAKDLGLAQQAAQTTGQATEFGAAAARRFREFANGEAGELDFSAIYRTIHK
jgi:3-hydroxyisobutyrate dehydrogenase